MLRIHQISSSQIRGSKSGGPACKVKIRGSGLQYCDLCILFFYCVDICLEPIIQCELYLCDIRASADGRRAKIRYLCKRRHAGADQRMALSDDTTRPQPLPSVFVPFSRCRIIQPQESQYCRPDPILFALYYFMSLKLNPDQSIFLALKVKELLIRRVLYFFGSEKQRVSPISQK